MIKATLDAVIKHKSHAIAIRSFFLNGATVRGLVKPGADGKPGTSDDILAATGETLAQVQDRVLGPGASSAPLFRAIPGFLVLSVRGGIRFSVMHDLTVDFENLTDRNYRGISMALDGRLLYRLTRRWREADVSCYFRYLKVIIRY